MTEEIIARLRSLDLSDGGSHSRLSAIASCFYQPTFGWTRGACETLRDKLIETMEGKDGNDDNDHADDCNCAHHRCDQHGRQVSYDELGNERQKAIAELRDIQTDAGGFVKALANALGVEWQAPRVHQIIAEVRDRLIHLIGGDQPTLSDLYGIWQAGEESESRGGESAHKMTKSAEIGESGVDSTNGQSHESSPMRQENETRITDDLRNYLDTYGQEYENFSGNTIGAIRGGTTPMYEIADRIDERARLGAIKADIWQDYASQMRAERDELQEKNRHLAEKYDAMLVLLGNGAKNAKSDQERRIEKLVRQRDELREKLKEIGGIVNG